ncbi:MAG: replication initiation protein [Candidatus Brocadiales bacterium]|nr:replication initiation protein [Candidatus Brocadiales bacterium]
METLDRNLSIVKSNKLALGLYNLTLNESRLIEVACSKLKNTDINIFPTAKFKIRDVLEIANASDESIYSEFENTTNRLMDRKVKIETIVEQKRQWITYHWVDTIKYHDGVVELKLHDNMIPFLLEVRKRRKYFTTYRLGDVLSLPTFYSQRLFMILKSNLNLESIKLSVEEWRNKLGLEAGKYRLYGHFKSRVLLPAIEHVRRHSYIENINFIEEKVSRKVVFITLNFNTKVQLKCDDKLITDELLTIPHDEIKQLNKPLEEEFIQSVAVYKISRKNALAAIEKYGFDGAIECRNYALADIERRKNSNDPVHTPGAYLNRCLVDGIGKVSDEERAELAKLETEKQAQRQVEHGKFVLRSNVLSGNRIL